MIFQYQDFKYYLDKTGIESSLFIAISGSHAYGWNRKDSDLDIRRVYFPNIQEVISSFFQAKPKKYKDNLVDVTEYPVSHFLKLLSKGNGNCLDNLFEEKLYEKSKIVKELQEIVLENIHSGFIQHCLGFYSSLEKDMKNETRLKRYGKEKLMLQSYKILMEGNILGVYKKVVYNIPRQLEYCEMKYCKELLNNYLNYEKSTDNLLESCQNEIDFLKMSLLKILDETLSIKKSIIQIPLDRFLRNYYLGN